MIYIFVIIGGFLVFYYSLYYTILYLFGRFGVTQFSNSTIKIISTVLSITIIGSSVFIWYKNMLKKSDELGRRMIEDSVKYIDSVSGPIDKFEVSNFQFEKGIKNQYETFFIFYSCDLKNKGEDLKNFEIDSKFELKNFNNDTLSLGKYVENYVNVFDSGINKIDFDDINIFRNGQTVKLYGYFELKSQTELKWIKDKIPFKPELIFKVSGSGINSTTNYFGRELKSVPDLNNFIDTVNKYYDQSPSINNNKTLDKLIESILNQNK